MEWKRTNNLPAFKITFDDGDTLISSMASGITLEKAKAYYMQEKFVADDEVTMRSVVSVEQIAWE